jgi:hypothetical protein
MTNKAKTGTGLVDMHDIIDKNGNLTRIEVFDTEDNHVFDIVWDEREAQTADNRAKFRQWARQVVERYGYSLSVPQPINLINHPNPSF